MTRTRCAVVCPPCDLPLVEGVHYCAMHAHYFRVFLADPYWRDHEPPEPEAPQMPLDAAYLRREPGRKGGGA